jgi:hypothetical protein
MFLVEAKLGDTTPAANLLRFQKALGIPAIQLLNSGDGFQRGTPAGHPLLTAPAAHWLPRLP